MQASNFDLQAYFRRIGFSAGDSAQADAATLHALMRQQLFSVPFENLDVQAGKIVSLVPEDIAGKILGGARGGYCYEVNGLFAMALQALGIAYRFVAARPMFYPARRPRTHMALVAEVEGRRWLCDLGFGSYGIRAPMALDVLETEVRQDGDTFRLSTSGYGTTTARAPFINPVTGAGTTLYAAVSGGSEKQDTVDAYLSGKFELGGRKHDLVVGMSSTRTATRTDGYTSVAGWSYVVPNIYTWDGNAPAPTYSKTGAWRTQITQQTGLFASARWRVADPLSVLTGLRLTDWHRHSDTYGTTGAYAGRSAIQDENRKVTPFIGAVYDITPTLQARLTATRWANERDAGREGKQASGDGAQQRGHGRFLRGSVKSLACPGSSRSGGMRADFTGN